MLTPGWGWIGCDLDGTLATYGGEASILHIGDPIPAMVERVKALLDAGHEVRIFTARVCVTPDLLPEVEGPIRAWCLVHLGQELAITCQKDFGMIGLFDDRAIAIEFNTGRVLGGALR